MTLKSIAHINASNANGRYFNTIYESEKSRWQILTFEIAVSVLLFTMITAISLLSLHSDDSHDEILLPLGEFCIYV